MRKGFFTIRRMAHGNVCEAIWGSTNASALNVDKSVREATLSSFARAVHDISSKGQRLFFTNEVCAQYSFPASSFVSMLAPHFNLHVVVAYRRFFEWIVSWHTQLHIDWPLYMNWSPLELEDASRAYTPLASYLNLRTVGVTADPIWTAAVHAQWRLALRALGARGRISVLNLHDSRPLLTTFVCEHLEAPSACTWLRSTEAGRAVAQVSHNARRSNRIPLIDLVSALVNGGSIGAGALAQWHMHTAVSEVAVALKPIAGGAGAGIRGIDELPRTCASNATMEWLLSTAMRAEAELLPEWHNEARLRAAFARMENAHAFCSIDTDAARVSEVGALVRDRLQRGLNWKERLRQQFLSSTEGSKLKRQYGPKRDGNHNLSHMLPRGPRLL
mmetsp:Transcript_22309/g.57321  ORF Transcript_22309/g.57321 Transcript_22309/m.57321 type:complete len:388 (+) Transcript_22309:428-1591(+)